MVCKYLPTGISFNFNAGMCFGRAPQGFGGGFGTPVLLLMTQLLGGSSMLLLQSLRPRMHLAEFSPCGLHHPSLG